MPVLPAVASTTVPALAQCASRLGLGDNRGRHPVLGAAARIEELSFGEHAAAGRRREGR